MQDFSILAQIFNPRVWTNDTIGYLASGLVLATFTMKSMSALRVTAIFSNAAFLCYAWAAHVEPILILHGLLLPMNIFRLIQTRLNGPPGTWRAMLSGVPIPAARPNV